MRLIRPQAAILVEKERRGKRFLQFNADVHFQVVMSGNLKRAGLEALGKKWG